LQFFINLIDNAIKYNHKNSRIKISFFDPYKNYLVEITDEGLGIAEKVLLLLFERFYKTIKPVQEKKAEAV